MSKFYISSQVGLPILNKVMTFALLNLSSSSATDHIACCTQLMTSSYADTRLAVYEYLTKYSSQGSLDEFHAGDSSWAMLRRLVRHEPNLICMQAGLDLWVHVSLNASRSCSTVSTTVRYRGDDTDEIWGLLREMADGQKGTTLCASALPVLSIILVDRVEDGNAEAE